MSKKQFWPKILTNKESISDLSQSYLEVVVVLDDRHVKDHLYNRANMNMRESD